MSKIEVFNNPFKSTESFTAQGAIVQWGTNNSETQTVPMVITGLNITYGRNSQSIYPINQDTSGSSKRVVISGAPTGSLNFSSIFSPTQQNLEDFIKAVAKECKTDDDQVTVTIRPFGAANCSGDASNTVFYLHGVELESVSVAIQGGQVATVALPTVYSFTSLDWEF